jgi:hypothetical protein
MRKKSRLKCIATTRRSDLARLYSNENVALPIVKALRDLGHDVLTSLEAGKANQRIPDSEVLRFANEQGRVLLTNNRQDFITLHRSGAPHSGIVVFTADSRFNELADRIHSALADARGHDRPLVRVTRQDYRLE